VNQLPFAADDQDLYQAVSMHAVFGLLCGLAGALALSGPLAWPIAWLGLALSAVALVRIGRNAPVLTGRKAALAGLFLSALFAVAGPAEWLSYRWMVRREALQFARDWLDLLKNSEHAVSPPTIRTLQALGSRAEVRLYQVQTLDRQSDRDVVTPVFAVTVAGQPQRKPVFVRITMERKRFSDPRPSDGRRGYADWKVLQVEEGLRPAEFEEKGPS
jgi:hypothetical protein